MSSFSGIVCHDGTGGGGGLYGGDDTILLSVLMNSDDWIIVHNFVQNFCFVKSSIWRMMQN